MAKISVVIPAYNCKEFINETLESVFQQDYPDIEIIIVDDGSTDGTGELFSNIERKRELRYFYQDNSGPGSARNLGLSEAQGDIICFLDADDTLLPTSISKRVDFLIRHPEVGMVFTDLFRVISHDEPHEIHLQDNGFLEKFKNAIIHSHPPEYILGERYIEMALKHHPFIKTPTVMVRKNILEKVGHFDETLLAAQDVDFWFRIARVTSVGYIDIPLSYWNNYRSSITSNSDRFFKHSLKFYKKLYHSGLSSPTEKSYLKKKLSKFLFDYGYHFFKQGRVVEARQYYSKSLSYNPFQFHPIKGIGLTFLPDSLIKYLKSNKNSGASING